MSSSDDSERDLEIDDLRKKINDLGAYMEYAGIPTFNDKGIRTQVLFLVIQYLDAISGGRVVQCERCGNEFTQPEDGNPLCLSCYLEARAKILITG